MRDYATIQGDAVRRFLQTALVVDDHAVTEESAPGVGDTEVLMAQTAAGQVNVKKLADGFADQGISCAILQPTGEDERDRSVERIVTAGALADIIVLDWRINDENGRNAIAAITKMLEHKGRDRRLIAVYTTDRQLEGIASVIADTVPGAEGADDDELNLTVTVGGTRIVVLHKGGATLEPPEMKRNQVQQDDLPARLVDEFGRHAAGLVSAVALNALAAARENTHRMLGRLSGDLELGYAGHLLRIEHVDEGASHLIDAVVDEFRAVIQDDPETRKVAGDEGIKAWLDAHDERFSAERALIDALFAINTADFKAVAEVEKQHPELKNVDERDYTALLVKQDEQAAAHRSDARFAMLLSLRPPGRAPMLQLGSVVFDTRHSRYWLCIQPLCDSVRLDGPTRFPLLRLERLAEDQPKQLFHIVVSAHDAGGAPIRLFSAGKPRDLYTVRVQPGPDRTARFARDEAGAWRLPQGSEGEFVWLGELKPAQAQRVAEDLSGELSRIGLDESEWLRRRSDGGKKREPADTWDPSAQPRTSGDVGDGPSRQE